MKNSDVVGALVFEGEVGDIVPLCIHCVTTLDIDGDDIEDDIHRNTDDSYGEQCDYCGQELDEVEL